SQERIGFFLRRMTGKKTFLTVKDLAALLNLKASWIYERTTAHGPELIPHLKFGRQVRFDIESDEFRAWLKSHGVIAERGDLQEHTMHLLCNSVEMTGVFTKRKEKPVNATYQNGWLEWKTKASGQRACRIRYWKRDASSPTGWRKAASSWEQGLTMKQANRKLGEWMRKVNEENQTIPVAIPVQARQTLNVFAKGIWGTYRRNSNIKQSTLYGNETNLRKHILPELGERMLQEITPTEMTMFFDKLAQKGLSPKTQLNIYQLLHA